MKTIIFILFILASFKTTPPFQNRGDEFDKIFYFKKTNNPKELIPTIGKHERIESSDTDLDQYYFYKSKNQMPIKVFVNKKDNYHRSCLFG